MHNLLWVLICDANVRFGSKADVTRSNLNVRCYPESGHWSAVAVCPLCAKSGQMPAANSIIIRLLGVEAIKPDTEAGAEKWLKLNADYAKTWPNITVKRDPPADSKEWEGKPDKLKYFSPNPGTGD